MAECIDCGNMVYVLPRPPAEVRCTGCSNFYHLKKKFLKVESKYERLKSAAREYIAAHKLIRVRFQDASDAELYTEAAKALEVLTDG